ncbi:L-lysine exporter [Microbacterium sp.]|uniref:L-lysine exporter n=1 Tax=Microbacterium sp. TaxID=51671 RepID=UPI0025E34C91|nr:L-lysine exporter [Microbacterium sp.]
MLPTLVAGFGLGLSFIVAIGAQNLFVLRQGIRREHVLVVATVCAVSDALLIAVGVSGLGAILEAAPGAIEVVRWAGALFLSGYAILAARRAWRPSGDALALAPAESDPNAGPHGRGAHPMLSRSTTATRLAPVIVTCLGLTWLNPHVYLDTVFLLGSVAATYGDERWLFAIGAVTASVVWFFSLALGARYLARVLATPRAWRVLDAVIAVVMLALAVSLVLPR